MPPCLLLSFQIKTTISTRSVYLTSLCEFLINPSHTLWMKTSIPMNTNLGRKIKMNFSSVQSLNHVWLFVTSWTTAQQAFLSITNSWSSPKPMSIESVMPSNYLILCCPLPLLPSIFPSIRVFPNESALCVRWPKYCWVSASTLILPMNTQDWSPLGDKFQG